MIKSFAFVYYSLSLLCTYIFAKTQTTIFAGGCFWSLWASIEKATAMLIVCNDNHQSHLIV